LFLDAVADVRPLDPGARTRVDGPAPASPPRAVTAPDAEALAQLCDLVTGSVPFDISDSDEYIEGAMVGLDPRLLRRLRNGEFASQAHLDLHGMTSEEARRAVKRFLTQAYQSGKRCVLIVHGRGHNSKDQIPVLKSRLATWLARGQWARLILAFTSARPCDGGTGALYLLLRRQRNTKRPIRVITGAKW
jgi:DNA-nicking Smr family endonuclease